MSPLIRGLLMLALLESLPQGATAGDTDERMIVCYYPNWSQYRHPAGHFVIDNIDPFLCTHIIYAFAKIVGNDLDVYEHNDVDMYLELNALKEENPRLVTMLSVGGATLGTAPFVEVSSTPANRQAFSANVLDYLRVYGFDGVDMDWEFPSANDKDNHRELMKTLRETFEREALETGYPELLLSGALGAARSVIQNSYDLPGLARYMDFANVMAYDLHGGWDQVTGFHSALYGYSSTDEFAQSWVVEEYIEHGFPPSMMVLGVPAYGRSFTLCSPQEHDVRDCSRDYGEAGLVTETAGVLSYYEICVQLLEGQLTREYDDLQEVPYAYGWDQWVGYDDTQSITEKVRFVERMGLTGIMFWDISFDDFNNYCGGGEFPLINAAKRSLPGPTTGRPYPSTTEPGPRTSRPPRTTRPSRTTPSVSTEPAPRTSRPPRTTRPSKTTPSVSTDVPPATTREMPRISCDGYDDYEYFRSPYDCSVFYQCIGGTAYRFECPDELYFDEEANVCDWPQYVDCDGYYYYYY